MGERITRVDLEAYISVGGRREANLWVKPKVGERIQINKKSEIFGPLKDLAIKKARRLKVPLLIVDRDALKEVVKAHHQ